MGQVSPLPPPRMGPLPKSRPLRRPASPVRMISTARCALCGARLEEGAQRFVVVSPQSVDRRLTVCHTCRNATQSEGYRPAG